MGLGSEIRKKLIPDASVIKDPVPGSRILDLLSRISDPDPQHWLEPINTLRDAEVCCIDPEIGRLTQRNQMMFV